MAEVRRAGQRRTCFTSQTATEEAQMTQVCKGPEVGRSRLSQSSGPGVPMRDETGEMSRPLTGTQHGMEHSRDMTSLSQQHSKLSGSSPPPPSTEQSLAARGLEGRSFTWKGLARPSPSRGHWASVTDSDLCTQESECHSFHSQSSGTDMNNQG